MEIVSLFSNECFAHPDKPLWEHLESTGKICEALVEELNLNIPNLPKEKIQNISKIIGLYHDFGKATKFFQDYLLEDNPDKKARLKNKDETKHSLLSAVATYFAIEKCLQENEPENEWNEFLQISSFVVVRRHHSNLISILDDLAIDDYEYSVLKKQINSINFNCLKNLPYLDYIREKLNNLEKLPLSKFKFSRWLNSKSDKGVLPYLIFNLLYSILLDSDKHQTVLEDIKFRNDIDPNLIEKFRSIKDFNNFSSKINLLRNEIYQRIIDQVQNLDLNQDKILSITAPTGSGKTLTTMSFALKLRDRIQKNFNYKPRIIYCLPFLSIIDQNANVIVEVFKEVLGEPPTSDQFLTHHHLSDISYITNEKEYDTDESEILVEGWDSEIIITTFVQFFHSLFTNRKNPIRKFNKIPGSIVILDEIQSFPSKYWRLLNEIATCLTKHFNTFFILSTATQPIIFDNPKELLPNNKVYFSEFNRTEIQINIDEALTLDELVEKLNQDLRINPKNTMVVLNTIQSAVTLYDSIKVFALDQGFETFFLSSHITPYERLERISRIKEKTDTKKLIVTTQLVEAGVDIDIERVIRDIGPMDSIIQVAGRSNRNWEFPLGNVELIKLRDGKGKYFFSYIYDPTLIDSTYRVLKNLESISENDFYEKVIDYYENLLKSISNDTSNRFIEYILRLDYDKIGEFQLINDDIQKVDVFVEINEEASEVWERYIQIVQIEDRFTRRKQLKQIRNSLNQFIISVGLRKAEKNLPPFVYGLHLIQKDQLETYYDLQTGFKTNSLTLIY